MFGSIPLWRAFGVGLFETLLRLMVQPSRSMCAFEYTEETSSKNQLTSLVITGGTTLKIGPVPGLTDLVEGMCEDDEGACVFLSIFFILNVTFEVGGHGCWHHMCVPREHVRCLLSDFFLGVKSSETRSLATF